MALHMIRRGLDLPIKGGPEQRIEEASHPGSVAVLGDDYPGMKPTMHVQPGDGVRIGQLLFEDKKNEGVRFTSPGTGVVKAVNRGAKRRFESVVIQLDPSDRGADSVSFSAYRDSHPSGQSRDEVRELLIESGEWVALRARPFGRVAVPTTVPKSVFVNAMDTDPLGPDVDLILAGRESDFERGLWALSKLTDGTVYVCRHQDGAATPPDGGPFKVEEFIGKHPAGLSGTHIHTLDPVDRNKLVWWTSLQDVLAIGHLFRTGSLDVSRVVSLAGPGARNPRLLRTRRGASTDRLTSGETRNPDAEQRVISGSVLSGRMAMGDVHGYLGRYDQQIAILEEDRERKLFGWMGPGFDKFSVKNLFVSKLLMGHKFNMTTSTHGSPRAIVPIGMYEKVMPLDIMPTFLLRSLVVQDIERLEELGVLELIEEDLALCTFVCPGKIDYGTHLRNALSTIEREG